ncbi:hypothetical protein QWY31_00775 [Cytophagales bacterium LB-30]|uniref:Tetratricopeptide repeat protein n=1 Tax=Shiella aurantiaca TaxID=3058365 RepID=A0ABT8F0M8_9BACT|nr:hypothetical protein [Shiella aurantiaca]MDN4164010.1 hypothetical protein [Shiella aurantiaca]
MKRFVWVQFFLIISLVFASACASYYRINEEFNRQFESGQIESANKTLAQVKKPHKGKATVLHYLNRGVVLALMGEYEASNEQLEKAYLYIEDQRVNYFNEAVALLSNPMMAEYKPEDHELYYLHYYKALNYIKLDRRQEALVECRRLQLRVNQINEKYKGKHKLKDNAMVHTLMGIIYDANGEFNDAFIAYRNAYKVYQEDYQRLFGLEAPRQLKEDLLRTAAWVGLFDEKEAYEKEFGFAYEAPPAKSAQLVYFWNNGLGPVKEEWSINFVVSRNAGGVAFVNEDLGLNFAFAMSSEDYQKSGLASLGILRVAFPKYVERPLLYQSATVHINGKKYPLEVMEDVNAVAFQSLQQRMLKELGTSLLRLGLKKAAEYTARGENEELGAVVGIFNALTEKADTRNWQTLPHTLYYTRIMLPEGSHDLGFSPNRSGLSNVQPQTTLTVQAGNTYFYSHSSLGSSMRP